MISILEGEYLQLQKSSVKKMWDGKEKSVHYHYPKGDIAPPSGLF
jgi:hypothetical protein